MYLSSSYGDLKNFCRIIIFKVETWLITLGDQILSRHSETHLLARKYKIDWLG